MGGCQVSGSIDEYCSYQQQQEADENLIETVNLLVSVPLNHLGHLGSTVTETDHTAEVVVHSSSQHISQRNGDKGDGAKQDSLDRAKNGACTCNVQQVNEAVLPHWHWNIVYAVTLGVARCLAIIWSKDFYAKLAVEKASHHKNCQSNKKCNH